MRHGHTAALFCEDMDDMASISAARRKWIDSRLSTFPRGFNKKQKMLLAHFTSGTRRSRPVISLGSSRLRIFSRVGEMSRSEPSGRRL